jgi:methionine synthase I (cobalamin-dependent)
MATHLLGDGAYGTLLAPHLRSGEVADELCLREPHRVVDAHRAYIEAGATQIQTNSFLVWRLRASRQSDTYAAALECARDAIGSHDVNIVGTVGPAGTNSRDYWRALELLLELECPAVLCETVTSADEAAAFLEAWSDVAVGVPTPCTISCSIDPSSSMDSWGWIGELDLHDVSIGLNCCSGPEGLKDPLALLLDRGHPIARVSPSAGIPRETDEGLVYPYNAQSWAEAVLEQVADVPEGVVLGGCCGTTPDFIRELQIDTDSRARVREK